MNLEVLKHCAIVLFLESTLLSILQGKWKASFTITTRNRANRKMHCRVESRRKSPPSSPGYQIRSVPYTRERSLDVARMNLEVFKHCATVLFLESTLPNILQGKWKASSTITTRNRANGKLHCRVESSRKSPPSSPGYQLRSVPYARERSLDDAGMNLEVLKHCATVLFLESTLLSILQGKWKASSTITTRNRANGKLHCRVESSRMSPPSTPGYQLRSVPYARERSLDDARMNLEVLKHCLPYYFSGSGRLHPP